MLNGPGAAAAQAAPNSQFHSTLNIQHSTLNIRFFQGRRDDRAPRRRSRLRQRARNHATHLGSPPRPPRLVHGDRPQTARTPLHRHRLPFLPRRRRRSGAHAHPAHEAGEPLPRAGRVQPALHRPRLDDDVSVRRPHDGRLRRLPRAVDARHAQRRLPQAQRLRLLHLPLRRAVPLHDVLPRRRP